MDFLFGHTCWQNGSKGCDDAEHTNLIDLHLFYHATLWCKSGMKSKTSVDYLNVYKGCGICVEISSKLSLVHVIETLWLEKYHKHEACLYRIVLSNMSRSVWIEVMESSYDKVKSCYCGTDRTGQVLDYQTVPMLTQVLTGIFYYCSYIWASQPVRRVFHMYLLFMCGVRVIRGFFFVMLRVFIPAEVDGLAMKELGDTTDTVRSLFEHVLEICLFHSLRSFPVKKQNFWSWEYFKE